MPKDYLSLKEAFQYQNILSRFYSQALSHLNDHDVILKKSTTYFYSKACKTANDETVEEMNTDIMAGKANDLLRFAEYLLGQKEKLAKEIASAKRTATVDIDIETAVNSDRQAFVKVLQRMNAQRGSEMFMQNSATGYTFNNEGNQVSYRCDCKSVTKIDFDRKNVIHLLGKYGDLCTETSSSIDKALVGGYVYYKPVFGVYDSFEETFDRFVNGEIVEEANTAEE